MSLIAKLSVLVLLVIIALVFLGANRRFEGFKSGRSEADDLFTAEEDKKKPANGAKTRLLPCLILDQLDPRTLRTVKSFEVHDIPDCGVSVCNPRATRGDIVLANNGEESLTVSREHLRIGRDDEGIFAQDNASANKTYTRDGRVVDEIAVTDGLVLFLGTQPVRFRVPNPLAMFANVDFEQAGTRAYEPAAQNDAVSSGGVLHRRKK